MSNRKLSNRRTSWVYINLRNGSQLRANKRNGVIQIWYLDDYGDHPSGYLTCTKNETCRNTLLRLAKKMSYNDYFQFEWEVKRLIETSH